MLATVHQLQMPGDGPNSRLTECLAYLSSKFRVQIVMEEWAEELGCSAAAKFAEQSGRAWANVGTSDEDQYRTYGCPNVRHPGHDGTLPPDESAPGMDEYGPFSAQELREDRMATNVHAHMQCYETGLFILGIAHMHSLFGKLRSLGLEVKGYSAL